MRALLIVTILSLSHMQGGTLPTLGKKSWTRAYNGYSYRDSDMFIASDGKFLIIPKIDKKRLHDSYRISVKVVVEHREEGSKIWVERKINANGFEVNQAAAVPRAKAEFIGAVTGQVKFRFKVEHDKQGANITAEFVEIPDNASGQYRLSLVSELPDLYRFKASFKKSELSSKTRGDGLTISPVHEGKVKKKRYKMFGDIDLVPYEDAGMNSLELKTQKYGKSDVLWKLLDEERGTLNFKLKNKVAGGHKGFFVSTLLVDQIGDLKSKGLRIEVN